MKLQFPIQVLDQFDIFAFYEDAFSSEECSKIKEMFVDLEDGWVGDKDSRVDKETRKSKVKFIDPNADTSWIFQKFYDFSKQCNDIRWKFQLSGFYEGIQLTQYDETGSHYDWHMDSGNNQFSIRKLSLILLLDDPESYEGGELSFIGIKDKKKMKKGTLIIFPSYVGHRVHPVTSGIRRTAVAWISGEPYR